MADSFAKFLEYEGRREPILHLDFRFKKLPLAELTHVARSHRMADLESLSLSGIGIGDAGLASLSSGSYFANLRFLDLASNQIGDLGIEALVTSPNFPVLEELNLRRNNLRLRGAQYLSESENMPVLKYLNVDYNEELGDGRELLFHRFIL